MDRFRRLMTVLSNPDPIPHILSAANTLHEIVGACRNDSSRVGPFLLLSLTALQSECTEFQTWNCKSYKGPGLVGLCLDDLTKPNVVLVNIGLGVWDIRFGSGLT
mmetsp:Transcript_33025/g.51481  ORF Transcript_33025/g.51481 Transcript_33025/m.51481 type:complete len:105 (-) Transcript_33025:436-750(-)